MQQGFATVCRIFGHLPCSSGGDEWAIFPNRSHICGGVQIWTHRGHIWIILNDTLHCPNESMTQLLRKKGCLICVPQMRDWIAFPFFHHLLLALSKHSIFSWHSKSNHRIGQPTMSLLCRANGNGHPLFHACLNHDPSQTHQNAAVSRGVVVTGFHRRNDRRINYGCPFFCSDRNPALYCVFSIQIIIKTDHQLPTSAFVSAARRNFRAPSSGSRCKSSEKQ